MTYTTNHTLLQKMRDGDETSWILFKKFYSPLIATRGKDYKLDPTEIDQLIQDVLVACFQEHVLKNYDKSKGHFRDYLRTITSRKAKDIIDSRPKLKSIDNLDSDIMQDKDAFEVQWDSEWKDFITEKAMEELRESLDSNDLMAFDMYVNQGRPPEEVAGIFGITVNQVYLLRSRIVKKLKATIARLETDLG